MKLSDRGVKILFIAAINIVLLIPFLSSLTGYLSKSIFINEANLVIVDTVSFEYVSGETGGLKSSRKIEMTATNNEKFRIWNIFIDAINDKQFFLIK